METEQEIKMFPKQFRAYNFSTQFGVAVAGVQSGKTFLGANWAEKKIQEFPKNNGIIAAPTYKILQAATLKKFFEIAPYYRKYYKEQKGEIVLPTGGTIFTRSADNPLGIEGITAHWAWLDEGGLCSVLAWTVLRSRVSMTRGQVFITTTPYNMGWLYTDFYIPWKEKFDPALSFFTWRSTENPYFSKEFYEAEEKRLSPEEFSRRYMGEFNKMTGLVWDLPLDQIIEPIEGLIKKSEVKVMGVDWGFRNPAAIIILCLYDNAWYVVDEWKQSERITSEIIQVIQNKIKEFHVTKVYPDPAEPDRIQECKNARIPVYEANKDVQGGISEVRKFIYEKRFFVFNTCKEFLDEISMYHYPEPGLTDDKEMKEEPVKFNDHLSDALRYAVYSYQPISFDFKPSKPIKPYYGDRDLPF